MKASEAESYLTECERLVGDPTETLIYERKAIEQIANDACLPEVLNERATNLLCQIPL